ncbi:hypothetical protein BA882_17165 [Escherichia coli]|nr:hypothetical protein BA882_17165 [Escherichia coli]
MKTWIFICMAVAILLWFLSTLRRKPSQKKGCIDAIIPAYNEGPCLAQSLDNLLRNPYFCRVICVNDGSTDNTEAVMAEVKRKWGDRFVAVTQKNTGKGGALMNGLNYATCDQVFLSDADTYVPPDQDGMGYMLAEIERGADAVGGIPSTALKGAGLLPHIRATVKLPMIVMKRTLQQLLGGAPFIISGACGMFRTDVLRKFGFSEHWWKRQPLIPNLLSQELKNFLKLNVKEKNIQIADQVIIDESAGEVVIGANTRICHGAVIQGPVVIGANCLIGNYAFIRPGTIISNGVKIGFATEIKNAVIEAEATIGPQCFIADSVVANQAYLGAQVRTSNHRLDEQPVSVRTPEGIIATGCDKLGCYIGQRSRLGVQVIILPGRIISPNTQLGPRVIVERNLPTGTYSLRQELIRTGD